MLAAYGVKDSIITHILGKNGNNPCPNASEDARKTARTEREGKKKREREKEGEGSDSENNSEKRCVKRKLLTNVKATLKQPCLKISGQLLDSVHVAVTKWLKGTLHGEYAVLASDGWKDELRDPTYLVNLILATSHKKDGESMCNAFEGMIDKAEDEYNSERKEDSGDKAIVVVWATLLCTSEYFTENKEAAQTAEEATDLIGWVLNHGQVHSIFNKT
ncbi:hypothetical protein L208DRAFT_1382147 [Tricholoma matsutake]|nr:hypothetical protein L208DRAFT_1382147 [Tricholoma matsutake 945]